MTPLPSWLDGAWGPYLALLLFCAVPSEAWRWLGVLLARGLPAESAWLVWVRDVASALVMALVARLLLFPTAALAGVPFGVRVGAVAFGVGAALLGGRRPIVGVGAGLGALLLGAALFGSVSR